MPSTYKVAKFGQYFISLYISQLCKMEFGVQGWTTEYIVMEIDGKGVEYLGDVFIYYLCI